MSSSLSMVTPELQCPEQAHRGRALWLHESPGSPRAPSALRGVCSHAFPLAPQFLLDGNNKMALFLTGNNEVAPFFTVALDTVTKMIFSHRDVNRKAPVSGLSWKVAALNNSRGRQLHYPMTSQSPGSLIYVVQRLEAGATTPQKKGSKPAPAPCAPLSSQHPSRGPQTLFCFLFHS